MAPARHVQVRRLRHAASWDERSRLDPNDEEVLLAICAGHSHNSTGLNTAPLV